MSTRHLTLNMPQTEILTFPTKPSPFSIFPISVNVQIIHQVVQAMLDLSLRSSLHNQLSSPTALVSEYISLFQSLIVETTIISYPD